MRGALVRDGHDLMRVFPNWPAKLARPEFRCGDIDLAQKPAEMAGLGYMIPRRVAKPADARPRRMATETPRKATRRVKMIVEPVHAASDFPIPPIRAIKRIKSLETAVKESKLALTNRVKARGNKSNKHKTNPLKKRDLFHCLERVRGRAPRTLSARGWLAVDAVDHEKHDHPHWSIWSELRRIMNARIVPRAKIETLCSQAKARPLWHS
jgi:hypothetical protein